MVTVMEGIDVSKWQGKINFKKVKADGKKFVLIRAGYGKYVSQKDPYFDENYENAKAAGLYVGAYWYSYAMSVEEIKQEAAAFLEVIKGKQFEMPVYLDFEERKQFSLGKTICSNMIKAFCLVMEAANYFVGLYIYRSALQNYVTTEVANRQAIAVAEYGPKLNYSGQYGIWQYSSTGKVNGINTDVDLDKCYVDYPTIIKSRGKNGYTKQSNTPMKKSVDELAKEVIAGKWGVGEDRKNRLTTAGYNYNAVQNRVNEITSKKSVDVIAKEVIRGLWGSGNERVRRLTAAGYDYNAVQKRVNELMR